MGNISGHPEWVFPLLQSNREQLPLIFFCFTFVSSSFTKTLQQLFVDVLENNFSENLRIKFPEKPPFSKLPDRQHILLLKRDSSTNVFFQVFL